MSDKVELFPGDFCFTGDDVRIGTLLGSCVAITMWHPQLRIGGMCHYVLPHRERGYGEPDGRYADEAMHMFLLAIDRYATHPVEYRVGMFGGGDQFSGTPAGATSVPRRNIAAGLDLLARHGLEAFEPHLGGRGPRRITLEVATGEITMRRPDKRIVSTP